MPILNYQSGPTGGNGGSGANGGGPIVCQIPADAVVTGFTVWSDSQVEQIVIGYQSASQGAGTVTLKGSTTGSQNQPVQFQPGEYVTSIQGTFDNIVQTVQVLTNFNQSYGPYGTSFGNRNFRFDIPGNCRFAGIFGFAGSHIDSFGVYFVGPSAS